MGLFQRGWLGSCSRVRRLPVRTSVLLGTQPRDGAQEHGASTARVQHSGRDSHHHRVPAAAYPERGVCEEHHLHELAGRTDSASSAHRKAGCVFRCPHDSRLQGLHEVQTEEERVHRSSATRAVLLFVPPVFHASRGVDLRQYEVHRGCLLERRDAAHACYQQLVDAGTHPRACRRRLSNQPPRAVTRDVRDGACGRSAAEHRRHYVCVQSGVRSFRSPLPQLGKAGTVLGAVWRPRRTRPDLCGDGGHEDVPTAGSDGGGHHHAVGESRRLCSPEWGYAGLHEDQRYVEGEEGRTVHIDSTQRGELGGRNPSSVHHLQRSGDTAFLLEWLLDYRGASASES